MYILVINNDIWGVKLSILTINGTIINTVPPGIPAPENFVIINRKANSGIFSTGNEKPKTFNTITVKKEIIIQSPIIWIFTVAGIKKSENPLLIVFLCDAFREKGSAIVLDILDKAVSTAGRIFTVILYPLIIEKPEGIL